MVGSPLLQVRRSGSNDTLLGTMLGYDGSNLLGTEFCSAMAAGATFVTGCLEVMALLFGVVLLPGVPWGHCWVHYSQGVRWRVLQDYFSLLGTS